MVLENAGVLRPAPLPRRSARSRHPGPRAGLALQRQQAQRRQQAPSSAWASRSAAACVLPLLGEVERHPYLTARGSKLSGSPEALSTPAQAVSYPCSSTPCSQRSCLHGPTPPEVCERLCHRTLGLQARVTAARRAAPRAAQNFAGCAPAGGPDEVLSAGACSQAGAWPSACRSCPRRHRGEGLRALPCCGTRCASSMHKPGLMRQRQGCTARRVQPCARAAARGVRVPPRCCIRLRKGVHGVAAPVGPAPPGCALAQSSWYHLRPSTDLHPAVRRGSVCRRRGRSGVST